MTKGNKEVNILFKDELTLARKGLRHFCVHYGMKNKSLKQFKAIQFYCNKTKTPIPESRDQSSFLLKIFFSGKCEWINKNPKVAYISNTLSKDKKFKNQKLGFYETKAWQTLRKKVLRKYGRFCMKCGKSHAEIHVDHIKPRSLYPKLELDFDNLQVLCKECNLEKSNLHCTDYRPKDIIFENKNV
jgi:5-methylcytosine-specific restriction endonuclease McrA